MHCRWPVAGNSRMSPIEVLDTSVKIGLGALISGAAAYFLAKLNHNREIEKERLRRRRELFEEVAEQIEKFTHIVLKFWGTVIGFVRSKNAGRAISDELLNDISELRASLLMPLAR